MSYIKSFEEFLVKLKENESRRNERIGKSISPILMNDKETPEKPKCKKEPTEDEQKVFYSNSSYVHSDVQIKTDIDVEENRLYDPLKKNQEIGVHVMDNIQVRDHFLSPSPYYCSGDESFNQYPEYPYLPSAESNLTMQRSMKHRKVYNCTECTYQTEVKRHLADHKKIEHSKVTHRRKAPQCAVLKCPECSYQTRQEKHLTDHYRAAHNKIYGCMYCPFQFRSEDNLKSHVDIAHSEELTQLFKCDECSFECDQKDYLVNHYHHAHGFAGNVSLFQVMDEHSSCDPTEIEPQGEAYVITV